MTLLHVSDLFLLGLAAGVSWLPISLYRKISPLWLRCVLIGSGLLVFSRYVTMACFTTTAAHDWHGILWWWCSSMIGLTLPSVFALDQLIRHPAMSPIRLLQWLSPLFAVHITVFILGWSLHLQPLWQGLLAITQAIACSICVIAALFFMRKISTPKTQRALLGLAIGQATLGADGIVVAFGGWDVHSALFSEMAMLLALWYAYDVSSST